MNRTAVRFERTQSATRRWIWRVVLLGMAVSILWLANSVRTQGVADGFLRSSQQVSVLDLPNSLEFMPLTQKGKAALIFICGSGVAADAYAPMLRPIAEAGHYVIIVKLPYRFAPLASHEDAVVARVLRLAGAPKENSRWVLAGHALGGALAARAAAKSPELVSGLVLIGTTHPKSEDLSTLKIPVTKVYAGNDGIAPPAEVLENKNLLPPQTEWVEIKGGNHSQFGHYGHQLFDGEATVSRDSQQAATRATLLQALEAAERPTR